MEEWQKHIHLSGGKCFEMYFIEYNKIRTFKVFKTDPFGVRVVKDCETGERFEFNRNELIKREYSTLVEIECC